MASVSILRRKKPIRDGSYPIILRIIKDRKIKIISLGLFCQENQWNNHKCEFKKNHPNFIQRNVLIGKYKNKALRLLD